MSVKKKLKCYNLKIHSFTYNIRYKALFYSKWYSHNNELNTMTFHHPGHVVEILTSKLRQILILSALKRLVCNQTTSHTFTYLQDFLQGFLNYYCGSAAFIIRYSSYTYLSICIMHNNVLNQECWP